MKNGCTAWKMSLPLIFLLLSMFALSCTVPSVLAQEVVVPDEQQYKYTKPEEIWAHGNPMIMGTKGFITAICYEPLAMNDDVSMQYGINYKPLLAESWGWVADTTFEIKIRKIAHFSSGRPVTADDVAFSLENELRTDISGALSGYAPLIEGVEKVDDYTVHVKVKEQYARNKRILGILTGVKVLPKHVWAPLLEEYNNTGIVDYKHTDDPENWDPSGPYTVVSWSSRVIYFKRVDNYWGEQLGWLFAPEYAVCFGDMSSDVLFRMFDAHERDINSQSPEISVEWQRERSHYLGAWNIRGGPREIHGVASDCHGLTLNFERHPIFRERWFRTALAYALDYDKILDVGFAAQAVRGHLNLIHPVTFKSYVTMLSDIIEKNFPNTTVDAGMTVIPYDPQTAIEILKEHCDEGSSVETGWYYKGQKIGGWTVTSVVAWRVWAVTAEVVAKNLRDIGIDCQPNLVEVGTYFDAWPALDFDIITNWFSTWGRPEGIEHDMESNFAQPGMGPYWQGKSPCGMQEYWNGEYPPLPNIAGQVKELSDKLWNLEIGTAEFNATLRSLLEIVVPEIPMIPTDITGGMHLWNWVDRWNNWPTIDDPYEFRSGDNGDLVAYQPLKHVYPAKVRTKSFSLSAGTVESGTPVIASVTLENTGAQVQRYKIVINEGPARPGWELFEEGVLAWRIVKVPPGTMKVDIPLTIEKTGTYVLVVDNWRIGEFDPGEPLVAALTVTEPVAAGLLPAVEATRSAVSRVESTVGNLSKTMDTLSTSVSELSAKVSELSGVVAGSSSLFYATIGLQVIILAIVIIVATKVLTKKPT